ncbi:hypothetical protein AAHB34_04085 [Paenarthrobacter ureafaciens]
MLHAARLRRLAAGLVGAGLGVPSEGNIASRITYRRVDGDGALQGVVEEWQIHGSIPGSPGRVGSLKALDRI